MLRKLFALVVALPPLAGFLFLATHVALAQQGPVPLACPSGSPGPVGLGGPQGGTGYYCTIDSNGKLHVIVDSGGGGGGNVTITAPTDAAGRVIVTTPPPGNGTPAPPVYVTGSGNTIIKNSAGVLLAVANISTSAQPAATCTIFDNASTNSGNQMFTENGMGPMQVITMGSSGFKAVNGLTINCSLAPTGALLVEYL